MLSEQTKEPNIFIQARKNVMKNVQYETRKYFGNCKGNSKLSRAAWALVSGHPQYAPFLYGKKAGTPESYGVLLQIEEDAIEAARLMNWMRLFYYKDGNFKKVNLAFTAEKPENQVYDSSKVLDDKTQNESYEWHKKIQYRNLVIKSLLAFLLGLLTSFLLGLLFPGL